MCPTMINKMVNEVEVYSTDKGVVEIGVAANSGDDKQVL